MADQITDNRISIASADSNGNFDDLAGLAGGNEDAEVKIQGGGSIGEIISDTTNGILFDAGAAQDWSDNTFYIWINCGIVGLLALKANAGFTIRFCGAIVTDWFEVYVGGSDSWPSAIEGGWVQFVISIEAARVAALGGTLGGTNGSTPATSAIRYVGWAGITATVMTKMVDNTWMDEIRRLPSGTAGILVEGRNGGSTDWSSADIFTQLGNAAGIFVEAAGGAYKINTPIQFGINDASTHGFTDQNSLWLWDNQEFADSALYIISALGNSGGNTRLVMGIKNGTGNDAIGSQGLFITAADPSVRWTFDLDDPDVDSIGMYGCTFKHGKFFELDDSAVDAISCTYLDVNNAQVKNSNQLKNSVVAANTGDGEAFMFTDDVGDIKYTSFQFSDGHGIEIDSDGPITQNSLGNLFSNYLGTPGSNPTPASGSTDAAIFNNSGQDPVTLNILDGGDTPSIRNGPAATTVVVAAVNITLTGMKDNTEVRVYTNPTTTEVAGIEIAVDGSTDNRSFTFSASPNDVIDIKTFNIAYIADDLIAFVVASVDASIPIAQRIDRVYLNP